MAKQKESISGRVVAITGGARGIGKSTAKALVRQGCRVAIGDLDRDLAQTAAEELGGGTVAFELDVTDRDSFAAFLDNAAADLGPIDVVVNNAGIMPLGWFRDESDDTAEKLIAINLTGVILGSKLALAHFKGRGGHLVNIASQAGKAGFPGGATYCATKHAVVGLSEAISFEERDNNIHVSVVMPAVVNTELGSGLAESRAVKKIEPEDVADAIVEALQSKRFEVHVPRITGTIGKIMTLVPRSGREAVARALNADKVLVDTDPAIRAKYDERATREISHQ